MDRRTQKTRAAIFLAFNELLSKENYSKITVQEIIDQANIGRSTFYSHFETKDALLKAIWTDLFSHVFSANLHVQTEHHPSSSEESTQKMVSHILYHLLENRKNISGILSCESADLFLRYFKEYLELLIRNQILHGEGSFSVPVPLDFLINYISGSFIEMVKWWFQNDAKQSPDELAQYFCAVIFPIIGQYDVM